LQRLAHRFFVVYDGNQRSLLHFRHELSLPVRRQELDLGPIRPSSQAVTSGCAGSATLTVTPDAALLRAQIRPPCASTIVLQTERPRPMPFDLVVTNGSKMRSRSAGGMPLPRSETDAITEPSPPRAVLTSSRRSSPRLSAIASHAFITRFSSTCWS